MASTSASAACDPAPMTVRHLPHAYPFLLVDRVLMIEPSAWAVVVKTFGRDEAFVADDGRFPTALFCEMMAQAAGLAVGSAEGGAAMLAAVDRFRCRASVVAGDRFLVIVRVLRRLGMNIKARALVRSGARICAAGDLVLHFVSPMATRA